MHAALKRFQENGEPAVLIKIASVKGSTPREQGAWMLISKEAQIGTIGGGQLEYLTIDHARAMLSGRNGEPVLNIPLGPEIGQCCGGRVEISFTILDETASSALKHRLDKEQDARQHVYIFGSGHTGKALANALAPLPVYVCVVETREHELKDLPPGTAATCVAMPEATVAKIPPGSAVVILTHDHTLDFLVAAEALQRDDLAYIGMIGSETKRATFSKWLQRQGLKAAILNRLTSPIGGKTRDKRPEVIAALTAAEVLIKFDGIQATNSQTSDPVKST